MKYRRSRRDKEAKALSYARQLWSYHRINFTDFYSNKKKFRRNYQATPATKYKIQGSETHFPVVGFGLTTCI